MAVAALGEMAEMNISIGNRGKYRCGCCPDEAICESAGKWTFTALTKYFVVEIAWASSHCSSQTNCSRDSNPCCYEMPDACIGK